MDLICYLAVILVYCLVGGMYQIRLLNRVIKYPYLCLQSVIKYHCLCLQSVIKRYHKTLQSVIVASGHDLYYYSETEDRMEVDFLLTKSILTARKNIIPLGVKSGKGFTIASLDKYRKKFSQQVGECFVLYNGDICDINITTLSIMSKITYFPAPCRHTKTDHPTRNN